ASMGSAAFKILPATVPFSKSILFMYPDSFRCNVERNGPAAKWRPVTKNISSIPWARGQGDKKVAGGPFPSGNSDIMYIFFEK
ncbi:MAG TPA: hypothetical protein DCZ91_20210, partial [Lachnospiraceae bacterium]|nr:hypothetical protein [Lachnospiraceae bacterium]